MASNDSRSRGSWRSVFDLTSLQTDEWGAAVLEHGEVGRGQVRHRRAIAADLLRLGRISV